ncbi:DMT family transporter [Veillonella sp. CHU110]|uniref:DMT family transporter n=1 Tax=Veillonella sp. CHU110 TaxID=2490947 RepID=UPI000F8CBD8B|nr:DMT family transporter [Veillonella sp. CHU110]
MNSYILKGMLYIVVGAVLWGFSGMCSQFVQQERNMPAEWVVAMRLTLAGAITVLAAFWQGRVSIFKVFTHTKDTIRLIIFGILGMWLCQYTYFKAIAYAGAGIATVLQYVGPALIILYVSLRRMALPRFAEAISVILATIGTAIIALQGEWNLAALDDTLLFWGLTSAVAVGIYTVQPVPLLKKYGTAPIVGFGMLIGGVFAWIVTQPSAEGIVWDLWAHGGFWSIIIFGTVVSFNAYLEGVRRVGAVTGSILSSIEPISAAVLAWLVLGNEFSQWDMMGMTLIIITIFILAWDKRRATES